MCTVSFFPKGTSYLVGMNRDELLTRGTATPPRIRQYGTAVAIYPTDAEGGTWIGANDAGISLAILNWNSFPQKTKSRSRGEVIVGAIPRRSEAEIKQHMGSSDFAGMRPFRLVGLFPTESEVVEWRWDGMNVESLTLPWQPLHWFSSGLSDAQALAQRRPVTQKAAYLAESGSSEWLRELHSSHSPERGAFSICVHRDDAATLSYTEIEITDPAVTMKCLEGSPCAHDRFDSESSLQRISHNFASSEGSL
jgi:hypothetical protein